MPPPTPVKLRAADLTFFMLVVATSAFAAAYFFGRGQNLGAAACGAITLIMALCPLLLAGASSCPHCAAAMTGLPIVGAIKPYVRCVACRRYMNWSTGKLAPLAPDHLANHAEFALPVDSLKSLPSSCCVCLQPSSRTEELVYSAAMRTPGLPTGKSYKFKVAAPYCANHFGEAKLAFEDLSAFPGISPKMLVETTPTDDHFVLKVRSYGFYRTAAGLS